MSASVIARIAKIVPLAVIAAVGVTACGPADNGAPAAASAPVSTPAAVSVTPGAGAVPALPAAPTTDPAAPTAAPAPAETPEAAAAVTAGTKPAAKPTAAKAATAPKAGAAPKASTAPAPSTGNGKGSGSGIGITFTGLDDGRQIELNDLVSFSVTWKNNDATGTRSVAPVVATQQYEGAPCSRVVAMADGTLERKDASGWKKLDSLSQGTGMDYVTNRNDGAFTLAAGESRTIEYRMRLSPANRPGRIGIEADAPVPGSTDYRGMAKAVVNATVVDHHGPEVTGVSAGSVKVGTSPTAFGFVVSAPEGTADLHPVVSVSAADELAADDVTVEAMVGGAWKPVELKQDCEGLTAVAPTGLEVNRWGDSVEYAFRIALKKAPVHGDVEVLVGARSNGHQAARWNPFAPLGGR
ncbi:hypothetical protein [Streptomyces sp. 1331.2]|uniref:hypothetical protein n=1 Tax=Streptomyces sp. 1331.2 TaxID=1938835 RepID=UPI000BD068BD|nr:hypothetical protein [Streptomyces sp. 1331.2]SOB83039.1 hypothetical protein SAMN06272789_3232 [Streptomyces sp. 1331.2]